MGEVNGNRHGSRNVDASRTPAVPATGLANLSIAAKHVGSSPSTEGVRFKRVGQINEVKSFAEELTKLGLRNIHQKARRGRTFAPMKQMRNQGRLFDGDSFTGHCSRRRFGKVEVDDSGVVSPFNLNMIGLKLQQLTCAQQTVKPHLNRQSHGWQAALQEKGAHGINMLGRKRGCTGRKFMLIPSLEQAPGPWNVTANMWQTVLHTC